MSTDLLSFEHPSVLLFCLVLKWAIDLQLVLRFLFTVSAITYLSHDLAVFIKRILMDIVQFPEFAKLWPRLTFISETCVFIPAYSQQFIPACKSKAMFYFIWQIYNNSVPWTGLLLGYCHILVILRLYCRKLEIKIDWSFHFTGQWPLVDTFISVNWSVVFEPHLWISVNTLDPKL